MAINTLITIKDAIQAFVDGHEQLQRVVFEAEDHRSAYITEGDTFPMLFVAPIDVIPNSGMNNHTIRIYVYERINDDRTDLWENANDTSLILRDIRVWWNSYNEDSDIEIVEDPTAPFVSDKELDKLVGYYADFIFEIPSHGRCDVPVSITPVPTPVCLPVTVENSDDTYNTSVASGGTLVVPDSDITLNGGSFLTVPATIGQDVLLQNEVGAPIVPDSVIGNVITINDPVVGCNLMPINTGQTVIYATYDDGYYGLGRLADWFTLSSNNPTGDTVRFKSVLNDQDYTTPIVIDWAFRDDLAQTVLGWELNDNGANIDWANSMLYPNALNIGGFTLWRPPNDQELQTIKYTQGSRSLAYAPFNDSSNVRFWSGTTPDGVLPSWACMLPNQFYGVAPATAKTTTSNMRIKAVRTFTYAELGL